MLKKEQNKTSENYELDIDKLGISERKQKKIDKRKEIEQIQINEKKRFC